MAAIYSRLGSPSIPHSIPILGGLAGGEFSLEITTQHGNNSHHSSNQLSRQWCKLPQAPCRVVVYIACFDGLGPTMVPR